MSNKASNGLLKTITLNKSNLIKTSCVLNLPMDHIYLIIKNHLSRYHQILRNNSKILNFTSFYFRVENEIGVAVLNIQGALRHKKVHLQTLINNVKNMLAGLQNADRQFIQ